MKNTSIESRRSALSMAIAGLRLCGIWSLDSSSPIFLKLLNNISNIFGITALIIFVGTLTIDLILNSHDLLIATDDGCYLAGISVIVFKVYNFCRHHKRIKNLIDATYRPIYVLQKSTDVGLKRILDTTAYHQDLEFWFFVLLGSSLTIALMFFVPTKDGALPIRAAYPFDTTKSPMYEIAFILQFYAVAYGIMAIVFIDTVGLGIIKWINIQCLILASNYTNCRINKSRLISLESHDNLSMIASIAEDIKNINDDYDEKEPNITTFCPFDEPDTAEISDCFVARFKRCTKNHQQLLDTVDQLNDCFSSSMLMQLFASFSMICLTGFQAVLGATTKTSLIKFVLYLGAACTQLFNWSWVGNELLYQKVTLLTSQWTSGWENELDSNIKPLLIMSMIKTMRPIELQAGGFFTMSIATFLSIIKSSYSFFALLTTLTE